MPITEAPFLAETLRVPHTYCWSPGLVPKPKDWGSHIDVSGFIFREPPYYEPPQELVKFLKEGAPPVYIGFGSIVVDQPEVLLRTVIVAARRIGVRAIISSGWSKFKSEEVSKDIFFVGDCPHEWLFQHVTAVVHHGGAGTTAAGLLNGRPTTIVTFFGDQQFWGERIAAAGAGPHPIPHKSLNVSNLEAAVRLCLKQETVEAAQRIAQQMRTENGVQAAAASFYRHLPVERLRCSFIPSLPAVYKLSLKSGAIKVSGAAAETLLKHTKIRAKQLQLYEPNKIEIENRRWDPITSSMSSTIRWNKAMLSAVNDIWYAPHKRRQQQIIRSRAALEHQGSRPETPDPNNSEEEGSTKGPRVTPSEAAKMVGLSALSIPKLHGSMLKGMLIDTPYAVTEGFRNTPKLYGEQVPDHEPVTDWKSGGVVGGTEFLKGMSTGLLDFFVQPYKGAKDDGARGFFVGLGKGTIGTVTKVGSGTLGLWSYPVQGAWRSVYDATHGATKKKILRARRAHDLYWSQKNNLAEDKVLEVFESMVGVDG